MSSRLVVVTWLVALAIAGAIVLSARLVTDLAAFLPAGATPEQELIVDQLHRGAASGLLIIAVGSPERTAEPGEIERLREELRDTGLFRMVATRPDPELLTARDQVLRYRYLLSDRWSPRDFSEAGLRATFAELVQRLRGSGMPVDENLAARDPTGELRYLLERWLGRAGLDGDGSQAAGGVWRLGDGRAVILAMADAAAYDLPAQAQALDAVETAADGFDPVLPVEIGGAPAVAVGSRDIIRAEVIRVTALASVAAILVLAFALRSLRAAGLALLPVLSGLVAGAAVVRLGFGEIHGITLAFGATLLGVTLDYPLHHLWRSRLDGSLSTSRVIRRPLFIGAASTALGFAALAIAGVSGLQQLAVLAVTGIVTAATVTSWVLPALARRPAGMIVRPATALPNCPSWLPLTLAGSLVLAGVLVAGGPLRLDTDLTAMSPVPAELAARDGQFRRELGFAEPRHLVLLEGDRREAALRATERTVARLDALVERGDLDRFDAVTRLLPSARTQRERARKLPPAESLRAAVTAAADDLPLRVDAFDPFVDDVQVSRALSPLKPEGLAAGMLRSWIGDRLMRQSDRWVSLVYLGGVSEPGAIAAQLADGSLIDLRATANRLVTGYQRRAMLHFAIGAVLIAGVLLAGLPSPRRALQILLIAGGAAGGTVLLLAALGTALSVFHVIALLLVVGLSIDYGVFARPGDGVGVGSVSVCALSSALAFAILATADIPLLRAMGVTVACGTVLAWGLALLFAAAGRDMSRGQIS